MNPVDAHPAPAALAGVLAHLRAGPQRTWSIVVTVFGDAVVPRGGSVWLGTLLDVFAAMDIPAGAVRTAMSRLTADGWLERDRAGRHSFYRLTDAGRSSFAPAEARIYGPAPAAWDGRLRLIVQDGEGAAPPGWAAVSPGLMAAAPGGAAPEPGEDWVKLEAQPDPAAARRLARRIWPVEATEAAYGRFAEAFAPLRGARAEGLDALAARTLLIHEYRRAALRDPRLPPELLPDPWAGTAARALCAALYRELLPASEAWLDAHGRGEGGRLPSPAFDLSRRFAP